MSDANDEVKSLCAWMKAHYEHLRGKPLDCARDGRGRGWRAERRTERSDIVSVKVGWSDTRDKCPAGVTHQENLQDLPDPRLSTCATLLHRFLRSRSPTIIVDDVLDNCRYFVQVGGMRDDNFLFLFLLYLTISFYFSAADWTFNNTVSVMICRNRWGSDRVYDASANVKGSLTHRKIRDH